MDHFSTNYKMLRLLRTNGNFAPAYRKRVSLLNDFRALIFPETFLLFRNKFVYYVHRSVTIEDYGTSKPEVYRWSRQHSRHDKLRFQYHVKSAFNAMMCCKENYELLVMRHISKIDNVESNCSPKLSVTFQGRRTYNEYVPYAVPFFETEEEAKRFASKPIDAVYSE